MVVALSLLIRLLPTPVHRLAPPSCAFHPGPACCTVSKEVTLDTGGLQRSFQLQFVKAAPPVVLFVQARLTSRSCVCVWEMPSADALWVCSRRQFLNGSTCVFCQSVSGLHSGS